MNKQPHNTPTPKPAVLLKRVGRTTYRIKVHFSDTSKETINDKITRLIQLETLGKVG